MGPLPFSKPVKPNSNSVEPVFVTPQHTLLVARLGAEVITSQISEILQEKAEPVQKLWDLDV